MQERLAIIRELGHPDELGFNFCILAHIHNDLGEYQAARKQALEALTISKQIGHIWLETLSLSILTETAAGLKDLQAAWSHFYEALELAVNSRAHPPILIALANLAFLLAKDTKGLKRETTEYEPTVYWAGDTVWYAEIRANIGHWQPEIIITHSGGAIWGEDELIVMDAGQTVAVCQSAPEATVVATHLEALDHCPVSRAELRQYARQHGIRDEQLRIPEDGAVIEF